MTRDVFAGTDRWSQVWRKAATPLVDEVHPLSKQKMSKVVQHEIKLLVLSRDNMPVSNDGKRKTDKEAVPATANDFDSSSSKYG